MGPLVIDASVLVAVLVEDPLSRQARSVLDRARGYQAELHAPELLVSEVGNALWKAVRRRELAAADAIAAIRDALALAPLALHPLATLGHQALALAITEEITTYDACYVALAIALGATLVTGDRRLADRAAQMGLAVERVAAWRV